MTLRVLLVIDSLASGGAQRQMVNLACGLARCGCDVEMFIYHPQHLFFADVLRAKGITVHAVRKPWRFSTRPVRALRRLIRQGAFDGVISFLATPNIYAEIARLGMPQVSLVVSERNTYPPGWPSWRTWWIRRLHGFADHVTANTQAQAHTILESSPWLKGRVTAVYNGVDLEAFKPPVKSEPGRRPIRLLAVGSIIDRKNMMVLMRGLDCFRRTHGTLPFVLDWAGKRREDREGRRAYDQAESLRHSLGLAEVWTWLGERRDMSVLMPACDALVHPGEREGLPNAICEALACGRPVLAARVADNQTLVEPPRRGYLFDAQAPEDVARALGQLLALTPDERRTMETEARGFAEARLSLEDCALHYAALLEGLVRQRRDHRGVSESRR